MQEFFSSHGSKELFQNTEIYQLLPSGWLRYPTIQLDFSRGISSVSVSAFTDTVLELLEGQAKLHKIDLHAPR